MVDFSRFSAVPGTLIVVVLDRSGSMETIRDDTIGGLNAFLAEQQKVPGECAFTLTQFDTQYEIVHQNVPLGSVPPLTRDTFVPRGSTALLDAIGRTINAVDAEITSLPKNQRPGRIYFVISTDGMENASREFTRDKVFEMIKKQKEEHHWDFVFLAANQDAIQSASTYGIGAGSSLSFMSSSAGVQGTYSALSKKMSDSRMRVEKNLSGDHSIKFDEKDRSDAMKT